ncbi:MULTISPECIES: TnsA endonuclease N-terminal domain-containing protein [Hyphomicrobiales]|jgi:hypothetical protein|uniref:TnsA endonuclease N-terminal domain-containing protein n=1 Tax=Methylobacterium sp. CCH7-A2 TaxID=1768789 RepID=UPI0009E67919|nr:MULTISPECIES: TnsA endonuclease N-terminal domain-containing protein [Hyphomicrobiales]
MSKLPSKRRNVIPYSRDGYRGEHPVARSDGRLVQCESLLELDALMMLDAFDRNIVNVESQPFIVKYRHDGRFRKWTPDFMIVRTGVKPELVEVKTLKHLYPADPLARAETAERFKALKDATEQKGFKFRLLTEAEIRVQPALYNAKLLCRHSSLRHNTALIIRGRDALRSMADPSVNGFQTALGPDVDGFSLAIVMDWLGHALMDRRSRFSRTSTLLPL